MAPKAKFARGVTSWYHVSWRELVASCPVTFFTHTTAADACCVLARAGLRQKVFGTIYFVEGDLLVAHA